MNTLKSLTLDNKIVKENWLIAAAFFVVLPLFLLASTSPFNLASADEPVNKEQKAYDKLVPYYYAAARTGDEEVISEFLSAGLPIDVKNQKGYTALMIATYNGQKSIVNTLIEKGANVCAQDNRGNTSLMAAIFRGEFSIAKTLMSEDCDENQQNKAGQTAVMYASLFGRDELKKLLIERGADIELQDNSGNSATSIEKIR